MYGVDDPNASVTMPAIAAAVVNGFFQPGNPLLDIPATTLTVDWFNIVQSELQAVLAAAGITQAKTTTNQVANSITKMIKATPSLDYLYFATTSSIAASATQIIGPSGVSASDSGAQWNIPVAGTITGVHINASTAPGGSATVTGTVFASGSASAALATITGSATSATYSGSVAVSAGQGISMHIVSASGAATTYITGWIAFTPT